MHLAKKDINIKKKKYCVKSGPHFSALFSNTGK